MDRNGVKIADKQVTLQNSGSHCIESEDDEGGLKGLFVSFRGQNGTGQNYQAKGFVLNDETSTTLGDKTFTSEMNIYAPIIDARLFNVSPNNANYYKIALDGYAVCEGGINRYVFSVDGGNTWHDMTLENSDTPAANASSTQLSNAAKSVDQFVSGQTRYELTKQNCIDKNKNQNLSFEALNADASKFTFADFTSDDAKNANFDDWKLTADLSDFKQLPNLDIIIAAVPATNQDLRCEILRIINYNQIQQYYTHAENIFSDITVRNQVDTNGDGKITDADGTQIGYSLLNAFYIPTLADYNNCENFQNFATMRGYRIDGQGAHYQIGSYTNKLLGFENYEDIPALFSDIPVYTKLSISGYAAAKEGIESFYWTVDGGKTWYPCGNDASASYGETKLINIGTSSDEFKTLKSRIQIWWEDGKDYTDDNKIKSMSSYFHKWDKTVTGEFTGYIQADLSAYEGQVVDVLFAAKPNNSDVYVPVAQVDNVGVYGAQGTFFTRLADAGTANGVFVKAGVLIDNHKNATRNNITYVEPTYSGKEGIGKELMAKWKVFYPGKTKTEGANGTDGFAYTILEINNVNPINARYYTDDVQTIKSGGRVSINGYVVCKGGVERYQFSLDGGKTWTIIDDIGDPGLTNDDIITEQENVLAQNLGYATTYSDSSLVEADAKNGSFLTDRLKAPDSGVTDITKKPTSTNVHGGSDYMLSFNIPGLPQGSERDLLVVAVNNSGKMFPVVHLKLKVDGISNENTGWGYSYKYNGEHVTSWVGNSDGGTFSVNRASGFTVAADKVQNYRDKLTIPVTQAGNYTLSFTPYLYTGITGADGETEHEEYVNAGIKLETARILGCVVYHDDAGGAYTTYSKVDTNIVTPDAPNAMGYWGYKQNENGEFVVNGVTDAKSVGIDLEITKADVARGYIVLEWNVTNLKPGTSYYFRVLDYKLEPTT